jgi:replicative DNA helicase
LLPQSPDAEKGVLSSFLIAPREIGGLCAEKQITKEHFFIPGHALIYETLLAMWDRNEPVDFITLTQILRDRGQLDQCGGAAFVTDLFTFLPTAANAPYYVEILQEKYTLREVIKICTEFAARGYDEQDDVAGLLDRVETEVFKIAQDRFKDRVANMKQLVVQAIGAIEELYSRRGAITGLSTGLPDFDKMTDGLHGAEMIVIAARPSMGKTALAMNIAEHIAVDLKKAVAVFSLEMSSQQLVQRLLCSRARVNLGRVRDGFLSERDFPALQTAASKLAESRFFIDDTSGLSILELRAKARRLKSQHDIQAIFIDYLQLLRSSTKRAQENRQIEIAEISSGLKALAKELNIPVVVLAQLNRNPEQRTGDAKGRPRLSDLRESGSIEQDADLVGLLVREEYYADSDEEKEAAQGKATLIIAKQRNGPVGDVPLTFLKEFTRFETRARESSEE